MSANQLFKESFELLDIPAGIIDSDGRVMAINAKWVGALLSQGYQYDALDELAKEGLSTLLQVAHSEQSRSAMLRGVHAVLSNQKQLFEHRDDGASIGDVRVVRIYKVQRLTDGSGALLSFRELETETDVSPTATKQKSAALDTHEKELLEAVNRLQEQEVRLLLLRELSERSVTHRSIEEVLRYGVNLIASYMSWRIGHAFVREEYDEVMFSSDIWYLEDELRYQFIPKITDGVRYTHGVGMVGAVMRSQQPMITTDTSKGDLDKRCKAISAAGLSWGLALPVVANDSVVAVLEFFSDKDESGKMNDNGFVSQLMAVLNVIADQKWYENILRNKEEEERAVIEHTVDAVITIDDKGAILSFNPAAVRMFGYSRGEVVGHNISILMPEPDASRHDGYLANYLRTGERKILGYGREVQGRRKDGTTFPMELAVSEYFVQGKRRFTGMLRDNTERNETISQLHAAKIEAEEASKAKSSFLAAMSHEIRTPMNGVIGMIDLLAHTGLDNNQKQMTGTIKDSAFSLLGIIDDILDFSKIEAGKLSLEYLSVELRDTLESVADTMSPVAIKQGVDFYVYCDPTIPGKVLCDPVRLRQILYNLASNAVKFTAKTNKPSKVVVLRVDLIGGNKEKVNLRFTVQDDGIGISEEGQKKLFSPFMQAEASTTRRFGGTGLGLSICRRLADMMEGELSLYSVEGEGSTFNLELSLYLDSDPAEELTHGLKDTPVTFYGSGELFDIISAYLSAAGVKLNAVNGDSLGANMVVEEDSIVVVDTRAIDNEKLDVISRHRGGNLLRIERGRRNQPRWIDEGILQLDGNSMHKYALYSAIAIAAGIEQLERRNYAAGNGDNEFSAEPVAPSVDEARANGSLILVAEDSETNQHVIMRQLNLLGYAAEIASDGVEALEMYTHGQYALLLTDFHMPRMDGVELTRSIRTLEADSTHHLPIVAITANAIKGEREKMISAGMDDYVSKPVVLSEMQSMLEKWLDKEGANETESDAAKIIDSDSTKIDEPQEVSSVVVDVSVLKEIVGDDDEIIAEFMLDFTSNAKPDVEEIVNAQTNGTPDVLAAAAHKLKSAARTIGANELADICYALEMAGKGSDNDAIDESMQDFEEAYNTVNDYILKNFTLSHMG